MPHEKGISALCSTPPSYDSLRLVSGGKDKRMVICFNLFLSERIYGNLNLI